MNRTRTLRFVALLISGVLAASTLTLAGTAPASAASGRDGASARWLVEQLDGGLAHNDEFDFDDYGLTADIGLALAAIQGKRGGVRLVARALAGRVRSWTTGVDFNSSDVYAGATAKAVVLAQAAGRDPRSFGGVDLVRQLSRRVSTSAPTVGRIQDKAATDFANTVGQALAAQGLARAGSAKADEVLRFLLKQQCSQGFFRLNFAPATAPQQGCDAGSGAASAPDTDATAIALLSLQSLRKPSRAVRSAVTSGVSWLKRRQRSDGSFGGGTSTAAPNTNSTGLAASALAGAGACPAALEAAGWVADLQVSGRLRGTPLAGEKGAIAYDLAALRAARKKGIGVKSRDQFRRATAQAAPALGLLSSQKCS